MRDREWEKEKLVGCSSWQILEDELDMVLEDMGMLKAKKDIFQRYVRELRDALIGVWDEVSREALNDAVERLSGVGVMTEKDLETIQQTLEAQLGAGYAARIGAPLYEYHFSAYQTGQEQILQVRGTFSLTDKKALKILHEHNIYWVGQNYGGNLYEIVERIGKEVIEQGLSKVEAGALFEKELAEKLQQYGSQYWEGFANHVVTRSREMGRVEGYVKAKVKKYKIVAVLDKNTSEICREMHGRIFEVRQAVGLRDAILAAKTPEEVKAIAPWRKPEEIARMRGKESMKEVPTEELPAGMELPPYHFRCRTRTIIEGK